EAASSAAAAAAAGPAPGAAAGSASSSPAKEGVTPGTDDILRELLRVQGAFRALTHTLSQAALAVQLDLMETLSSLLLQNRHNQREFRRIDGYSFILRLLDESADYSAPETAAFLQGCFRVIFAIVVDGSPTGLVGNADACRW